MIVCVYLTLSNKTYSFPSSSTLICVCVFYTLLLSFWVFLSYYSHLCGSFHIYSYLCVCLLYLTWQYSNICFSLYVTTYSHLYCTTLIYLSFYLTTLVYVSFYYSRLCLYTLLLSCVCLSYYSNISIFLSTLLLSFVSFYLTTLVCVFIPYYSHVCVFLTTLVYVSLYLTTIICVCLYTWLLSFVCLSYYYNISLFLLSFVGPFHIYSHLCVCIPIIYHLCGWTFPLLCVDISVWPFLL